MLVHRHYFNRRVGRTNLDFTFTATEVLCLTVLHDQPSIFTLSQKNYCFHSELF